MEHPDDNTLGLFVTGQLSETAEDFLELHLAECEQCRLRLDQIERRKSQVDPFLHEIKMAAQQKKNVEFLTVDLVLNSQYKLEKRLGAGGMGDVWKAFDLEGNRYVAVKFLFKASLRYKEAIADLRLSFQKIHKLQHTNICPLYGLFFDSKHGLYLAMKYIEGETLASYINRHEKISLEETVDILSEVANGLDYAHRQKVIHRDIKPQNIMIGKTDGVQIIDFDLADSIRDSLTIHSSIPTPKIAGTRVFMAPEQWKGSVNIHSDQYALAVTAYEMLSKTVPFSGKDIEVLCNSVLHIPPPPIKEIPDYSNAVLFKGLAKEPEKRFPDCRTFVSALNDTQFSCDSAFDFRSTNGDADGSDLKSESFRFSSVVKWISLSPFWYPFRKMAKWPLIRNVLEKWRQVIQPRLCRFLEIVKLRKRMSAIFAIGLLLIVLASCFNFLMLNKIRLDSTIVVVSAPEAQQEIPEPVDLRLKGRQVSDLERNVNGMEYVSVGDKNEYQISTPVRTVPGNKIPRRDEIFRSIRLSFTADLNGLVVLNVTRGYTHLEYPSFYGIPIDFKAFDTALAFRSDTSELGRVVFPFGMIHNTVDYIQKQSNTFPRENRLVQREEQFGWNCRVVDEKATKQSTMRFNRRNNVIINNSRIQQTPGIYLKKNMKLPIGFTYEIIDDMNTHPPTLNICFMGYRNNNNYNSNNDQTLQPVLNFYCTGKRNKNGSIDFMCYTQERIPKFSFISSQRNPGNTALSIQRDGVRKKTMYFDVDICSKIVSVEYTLTATTGNITNSASEGQFDLTFLDLVGNFEGNIGIPRNIENNYSFCNMGFINDCLYFALRSSEQGKVIGINGIKEPMQILKEVNTFKFGQSVEVNLKNGKRTTIYAQ